MVKPVKPVWIDPAAGGRLGRRALRSWTHDADGVLAARRAEIHAALGGGGAAADERALAEDFQAIASPAVRQAVLHLLRQVCDPD